MAHSFGLSQITDYLREMGLKIAHMNAKQNVIELAFHGDHGQWRMVIGLQQTGDASKLMLIVPHVSSLPSQRRLECLEALMAVNYRIAIGKFGLDLDDGEVRLEETIPLADNALSFEQFRLAFTAITQTASIYHSLLPRIIYGSMTVEEALLACEQDFFQHSAPPPENDDPLLSSIGYFTPYRAASQQSNRTEKTERHEKTEEPSELNVEDVLAEVTRMLREGRN